jgi:ABC-2 type transport system ATP-binding protein
MEYIKTQNLTKKFSRVVAVDNVSITIEGGKIYGLLGPNGSGKSTLMKLIAGLFHPNSGSINAFGSPLSISDKADIAYMPTEPYYYDYMTIDTIKNYYRDFYKDFSPEKYDRLIAKMGLSPAMKVNSLSSGMAAKLKMAATMARKAKIVMLDEPLNGIDLIARDLIISAIIEEAEPETAIIISSHLIDVMESLLDSVYFIKEGRIVTSGDAEDIRKEHGKSIVDLYKEVFAS